MKVRWTDASLRLRITPSELAELSRGRDVVRAMGFPGGVSWQIAVRPGRPVAELRSAGGIVELSLTPADVAQLMDSDAEGVYFTTGGREGMRFFIEKDFPCAHPHSADACEPESERFAPTAAYLARKSEMILETV